MKISEIVSGTKLDMDVYDNTGEKIDIIFVSQFEWSNNEESAVIAAPIHESEIYPIRIGSTITAYFYMKANIYKFSAEVIERGVVDNIALLKINIKSEIVKIQRRQFFRFEFSLPLKIREVNSFSPEYNEKIPFVKTVTKDLSGGGISVYAIEVIEMNKMVEVELEIYENIVIKFFGKIVRISKLEQESKYIYDIGISFKRIHDKDKEAIIKRIFIEQRKFRKKGLI
jgi:c-di-GMP-binding flagellar brake protein YcgR